MYPLKLSVIIPARNEERNIGKMVDSLFSKYQEYILEVIVVNDGSSDKTKEIIMKMAEGNKRIKLINRTFQHGVGYAIRDGIKSVNKRASHILTLDADFLRNVKDIKHFINKIENFDGLVGSRYLLPKSLIRYPVLKKIANRIFHYLCWITLGIRQKDLTNNFKFYKKEIFDNIPLTMRNFSVNAETGIYPIIMGYTIGEIPVKWYGRTKSMGSSKFNLIKVGPFYLQVLFKALYVKYLSNHFLGIKNPVNINRG